MTLDTSTLRALRAAGTQGEWVVRPERFDDWGQVRVLRPDGPGATVAMARLGEFAACDFDAHRAAGTDPFGPNAALIAAAVNAIVPLADEIDRLRAELLDRDARLADLQARYDNNRRTMLALAKGDETERLRSENAILRSERDQHASDSERRYRAAFAPPATEETRAFAVILQGLAAGARAGVRGDYAAAVDALKTHATQRAAMLDELRARVAELEADRRGAP